MHHCQENKFKIYNCLVRCDKNITQEQINNINNLDKITL